MADTDNVTLLSANMARLEGATITASGTLSGYYPEFAIDGNRANIWYSSSTTPGDYLIIDCGGTLPAAPDRFFLHGNLSAWKLYGSADGVTWGTALLDVTGQVAATFTTFAGSTAYRYFKFLPVTTITASQYSQVQQIGIYKQEYIFDDVYNPKFVKEIAEAGQERVRPDGGTFKPTVRELRNFSLPVERVLTAGYDSILAWWRTWRNQCAIFPEKTTYPQECYDLVAGPFSLNYLEKYKAIGYGGALTFKEY